MDDELNLTEEQEELLENWLNKFDHMLGYSMMKAWVESGSTIYAALTASKQMAYALSGLMEGKYPQAGRSPTCLAPSCEGSLWDGVLCNVGEETAKVVRYTFMSIYDEDDASNLSDSDDSFEEIYGSLIDNLFSGEEE